VAGRHREAVPIPASLLRRACICRRSGIVLLVLMPGRSRARSGRFWSSITAALYDAIGLAGLRCGQSGRGEPSGGRADRNVAAAILCDHQCDSPRSSRSNSGDDLAVSASHRDTRAHQYGRPAERRRAAWCNHRPANHFRLARLGTAGRPFQRRAAAWRDPLRPQPSPGTGRKHGDGGLCRTSGATAGADADLFAEFYRLRCYPLPIQLRPRPRHACDYPRA
jgi:hypothetical protein